MLLMLPVVQYSHNSSLCCYECHVLSLLVSSCGRKHIDSNRLLQTKFGQTIFCLSSMLTLTYGCYEL